MLIKINQEKVKEEELHQEYLQKKAFLDETDVEYTKWLQRGKWLSDELNQKRNEYIAFCGAYERGELVNSKVVTNPIPTFYLGDIIQKYQQQTYPDWIEKLSDYKIFEYERLAIVKHLDKDWMSLVDKNTTEPSKDASWVLYEDVLFGRYGGIISETEQNGAKFENVTLSTPSGVIIMDSTSLGANEDVYFQALGNFIDETDVVVCTLQNDSVGRPFDYDLKYYVKNGSIEFYVKNISTTPLSEALKINYRIMK